MSRLRSTAALGPVLSCMALVAGCPAEEPPTETDTVSTSNSTLTSTDDSTTTVPATTSTSDSTTTDSTPASTDDSGADSTTGPALCEPLPDSTNDCCCFATIEADIGVYIENGCPADPLCGNLQIECPTGPDCPLLPKVGGKGELSISDEAALDCILTALRDGTQGTLTWRYTSTNTPGYAYLDQAVHILPDRGVIYSALDVIDLGGEYSDVTRETLMAPERFDDCLQAAELPARLSCLLPKPTDDEVIEVCTEGGTYSKF